jgi:hypothetical protein
MISRNPLRRDLWARGSKPASVGLQGNAGWDMWRQDPARNPSLSRATDDDVWMEEMSRKNELARQLLAQQNARKSKSDADMLEMALNSGDANIFEAPQNDQDMELQKMMQGYVNAGTRGINMQYQQELLNRKRQIENANLNRQLRAQALDESQFIDSKRRNAQNMTLDQAKLQQQAQYRAALLKQRQQQMAYDRQQDIQKRGSDEVKQALDLVKEGMDPEDVIPLFKLSPRDQQLLHGYRASYDEGVSAEEDPMLDYLNESELSMRRQNPISVSQPGFFSRMTGNVPQGPDFSMAPERVQLQPGSGDDFEKLRLEAAKQGFNYDPTEGFYSGRGGTPPPAEQTQPRLDPRLEALPLVMSRADVERLPRGARFRTRDGRVMIKR